MVLVAKLILEIYIITSPILYFALNNMHAKISAFLLVENTSAQTMQKVENECRKGGQVKNSNNILI